MSASSTSGSGSDRSPGISRRGFMRLAVGGVSIGVPLLLSACTSAPAAAPTAAPGPPRPTSAPAPAAAPTAARVQPTTAAAAQAVPNSAPAGGGPFPSYIAATSGPTPDYHSTDPRITDGYNHYPRNPQQSWTKDPPGTGSTVNAFMVAYYPVPTPYDQNPTWQAVNKALNANVQMNIISGSDYRAKLGTLMAGSDLPDVMHMYGGIRAAANLPDFFKSQMADLTPYLAGDAITDYPNLAAIPTYAWKNSLCVIDGHIYQWPIHRYLPGLSYTAVNTADWTQVTGSASYLPTDIEDFKKILGELNHPDQDRYALGGIASNTLRTLGVYGWAQVFGAPNNWALQNGKLVKDLETDQYKAAVGFIRDAWSDGLVWQNALTQSSYDRPDHAAGKFSVSIDGFGNSYNDLWRQGLTQKPQNHFTLLKPWSAVAGQAPLSYLTGGWIGTNVMKKASPDRIKELLRILDYLAAPFGTQEDMLLSWGLAGTDYNLNDTGDPIPTKLGLSHSRYMPWQYMSQHPYVQYQPDLPGYAKVSFGLEQAFVNNGGVFDATLGYYAASAYGAESVNSDNAFYSGVTDIVVGRRPMSDYDQLVKDWQNNGGNTIRGEYTEAMGRS